MLSYPAYVKSVQQQINEIDIDTFNQTPNNYSLLIDVRETEEVAAGKIANAVHIPRGLLEAKITGLSPNKDPIAAQKWLQAQSIALYCRTGGRSALAAKSLMDMGLTNVVSIQGGTTDWLEKGLTLES
ncbi:rhodanese [Paraglaciecola aquimarina]|uniref:Rhodanese n=1 Tax=Paraglaciecola algarum TaxID=3050085 RepID=A0ABS9DEH6_9ALTE|nr:rhodanese-like domain-containing protein [Paraglaciecola sp. G1-23]MCF2950006.1 rhodanese [Paraglaciecola sp. G1-23]